MSTYDPTTIRPKRDFVCVEADPRKEAFGLIALPVEVQEERVTERTGTILRVGPGHKGELLGLKAGDKVVFRGFLKYANPVETGDRKREVFLMAIDDILAVTDGTVEVGCFSGSPSSPERK